MTELQLLEGSRDHVILLNMLMSNSNIYSSPDLKPIHLMKLKKSTEKKNQKKKTQMITTWTDAKLQQLVFLAAI